MESATETLPTSELRAAHAEELSVDNASAEHQFELEEEEQPTAATSELRVRIKRSAFG